MGLMRWEEKSPEMGEGRVVEGGGGGVDGEEGTEDGTKDGAYEGIEDGADGGRRVEWWRRRFGEEKRGVEELEAW